MSGTRKAEILARELRALTDLMRAVRAENPGPYMTEIEGSFSGLLRGAVDWIESVAARIETMRHDDLVPREPPEPTPLHPDDDPERLDVIEERY